MELTQKIRQQSSLIEPWWTLAGAPLFEEFLFRFLPYRFVFIPYGYYWIVGVISSILFALIHRRFGKWFVAYAFVWGLVLWWIMVHFGFLAAVLLHGAVGFIHFRLGFKKLISH